jgi:hypothetical protein
MPFVSRKRVEWTPEMERELWNLWTYGVHKNEIAERLGMSVAAVEQRYYRMKRLKAKEQVND